MATEIEPIDRLTALQRKLSFLAAALADGEYGGLAKEGLFFLINDASDEAGEIAEAIHPSQSEKRKEA